MRFALPLVLLMLATLTGCQSTTPLVQIAVAKQAYTAALNATTPLIEAGQISDRTTLMKIRDARTIVEAGLAEAETAARAGDVSTFKLWMDRVNSALELYLQLSPHPTTRPVSFNQETPWIPQPSSRSFSPERRPSPPSLALWTPSTAVLN
jgi:hypothetical protein